jgi:YVTN family beta-propeller protein
MKKSIDFLLFGIFIIILSGCVKLNPEENSNNVSINGNGLVLIGNEGNFQYGNSSLSSYNKNSGEISSNIYQSINQSLLGDVLHSISHIDHQLFLVVNNSGKIVVINDETFEYEYQIDNLLSPRKIIKVNNSKYYITDLYSKSIYIYNAYQNTTSEISVNGWCEDILMQNGKVYVCNVANNLIYVINSNDDTIMDSISVGQNPVSIKEDIKGDLWVLCQGSVSNNEDPSISIIETQTLQVIKNFNLESNQNYPSSMNIFKNEVFFINKHVYKISSIEDTVQEIIWENTGNTFYNLSIDPYNKDIYITDAKDYVQNGSLLIIDSIGNLKDEVITGIIPKSIVF